MNKVKWGSWIINLIEYFIIGWVMGKYGLSAWESIQLLLLIMSIQGVMNFIKEIVEY